MEIDRLVGLNVIEEELYRQYRENMLPILERYGGRFFVDVRVSELLLSPGAGPINRMFAIRFPNTESLEGFFSDPEYLAVRQRFFEASVASVTILGKYAVLE